MPSCDAKRGAFKTWCFATISISLCVLSPSVSLGQTSVAIVDISFEDELEPDLLDPVSIALDQGLRDAASIVVMPDVVAERLRQAGYESSCVEGACLHEVGALASVESLLRARISQVGQLYAIHLELLLARNGRRLGEVDFTCEVCTWTEALDAITQAAIEIQASMPGVLSLSTNQDNAEITIDNEQIDTTEPITLAPGTHVVEVSAPGHNPVSREVEISPNQSTETSIALSPTVVTPPDEDRAQPLQVLGWAAGGLAIGALIPGVLWLVLDGKCPNGADPSLPSSCPEVYDSWPEGLAMTVVAGTLALSSMAFFIVDSRRNRVNRNLSVGAMPIAGGAFFTVSYSH